MTERDNADKSVGKPSPPNEAEGGRAALSVEATSAQKNTSSVSETQEQTRKQSAELSSQKLIGNVSLTEGDASFNAGNKNQDKAKPGTPEANKADPKEKNGSAKTLEFDDPYGSDSFTRGIKDKNDPKHSKKGPESEADKAGAKPGQKPEQKLDENSPYTLVGKPKELDPKKPTVLFLDDFSKNSSDPVKLGGGIGTVPHGEISARPAEENGYNVIRAHNGNNTTPLEGLREVEKRVNSGELPLGKGDVINMSIGRQHDPTFEMINASLDVPVTPQTLAQNKDKLLDSMKSFSEQNDDPKFRDDVKPFLEQNQIIQRLQDKGITVVQSAGNEGPDRASLDFMTAKVQLGSFNPETGKADSFSADHSLLYNGPQDGVIGVKTNPPDMFSPERLKNDRGSAELMLPGANPVKFPITQIGKGYLQSDGKEFDRSKINFDGGHANLPNAEAAPLSTSLLSNTPMGSEQHFKPGAPKPEFNTGKLPSEDPGTQVFTFPTNAKQANDRITFADNVPEKDSSKNAAGAVAGTSFSNVRWLIDNQKRLADEKASK